MTAEAITIDAQVDDDTVIVVIPEVVRTFESTINTVFVSVHEHSVEFAGGGFDHVFVNFRESITLGQSFGGWGFRRWQKEGSGAYEMNRRFPKPLKLG
jgi:hypothetical protein